MKYKFETKTIGDCCDIIKKSIHPEKGQVYTCFSLPAFDNSNTPEILNGEEIKSSKFVLDENTILFNKLNPKFRRVWNIHSLEKYENTICSTEFLPLKAKTNIEQDYLYYYVSSPYFTRLMDGIRTGTSNSQQRIDWKQFLREPINVPSLPIQRKVVSLLRNIDKKIELNNAINNNLLDQALTLYATYFAESDKNGFIGDYCTIKSGFAFKSSWWTENGVKVIKIGSINQDNLNLAECSYVDVDKIDKAKDFKVGAGDLLIAMTGATIGKFAMVPYCTETLLVNQRVGKFFLGDNPVEKLPFIYCTLKQPDVYYEIVNRGQGSAQPNISAADIMSIPCVIPTADVLNTFNDTVQPLFDLIITNQQENQRLSELRDTLLPKLMSGELDVSDIDI